MPRYFQLKTDPARRLVRVEFEQEFWDIDVAERFRADILAAVASLRCPPGAHVVLVDLRNAVLQSATVFERMQALAGSATARRVALVASTPLARMQTKRLQIREGIVMFADIREAEAWLFEPEARTAA